MAKDVGVRVRCS